MLKLDSAASEVSGKSGPSRGSSVLQTDDRAITVELPLVLNWI